MRAVDGGSPEEGGTLRLDAGDGAPLGAWGPQRDGGEGVCGRHEVDAHCLYCEDVVFHRLPPKTRRPSASRSLEIVLKDPRAFSPDLPAPIDLAREPDLWLGRARVRPSLCEVVLGDRSVRLQPRVVQVLVALAQAEGEVVSRDELTWRCWRGVAVGEDAINRCVARLRRLFGEELDGACAIETLNRVGYRLTPLREAAPPSSRDLGRAEAGRGPRGTGRERPTLAVPPFAAPADRLQDAAVFESLREDLVAGLSRSKLLRVLSPRFPHGPSTEASRPAGGGDGVDYLVDVQIRTLDGRVRIAVHLIEQSGGAIIWSARHHLPLVRAFAEEEELAVAVVSALEPALLANEEATAQRVHPAERGYWERFVLGRRLFWRSTLVDAQEAKRLLGEALSLKPEDPPTLSLLAHCCLIEVWGGLAADPAASIAEASAYARQAIRSDGSDAFAHFTLGVVHSTMGRFDQDMAEQGRALELNPYLSVALGELGRLSAFAGRGEEALAYCDRAIKSSPTDPHLWLWRMSKAFAFFTTERYLEALEQARAASAIRPDYFFLHLAQAACAAAAGRLEEARTAVTEANRLMPRYSMKALKLGHPFVDPGQLERYVDALKAAGWSEAA